MNHLRSAVSAPGQLQFRQQGMVLFMSLVMMFVLTLLSLSALQEADMQQRIVTAARDQYLAFESAESGLRDAETFLGHSIAVTAWTDGDVSDGLYLRAKTDQLPVWEGIDWQGSNLIEAPAGIAGVHTRPRYIIELLTTSCPGQELPKAGVEGDPESRPGRHIFRITALGHGSRPASLAVLQTTYASGCQATTAEARAVEAPEQPIPGHTGRLSWRQLQNTAFVY